MSAVLVLVLGRARGLLLWPEVGPEGPEKAWKAARRKLKNPSRVYKVHFDFFVI